MKITKRQLRRIVAESTSPAPMRSRATPFVRQAIENSRQQEKLKEANADGTISDDEASRENALLSFVESELEDLVRHVHEEAAEIGGGFRGPGLRKRALDLMAEILHDYR